MASLPKTETTLDTLGNNKLLLKQSKQGYRFSIDSLLLWGFLRPNPFTHWVDLGSGCGILSIALAKFSGVSHVTAIEIQPSLATLLRQNAEINEVASRITLIEGDLRDVRLLKGLPPADGVCTNPPYYPPISGRLNLNPEKARARHEILGTFEDFLKAGSRLLRKRGTYSTILPVSRLSETLPLFVSMHLYPVVLRFVHPYQNQPATHFLITALKEKRGPLTVYPPLILYRSPGRYTEEIANLMHMSPLQFPDG